MRNNLLFIEANTTGTGMLALKKAKSWGMAPVFVTNKPERYLGLEEIECQVLVCDTNSLDTLTETIERHLNIEEICGIVTTSEFYLETVARLNSQYGLRGNTAMAMLTCRNKSLTRLCLEEANVGQPAFAIVQDGSQVEAALAKMGLPCVIKPADDSGSNDVLLCRTMEQAAAHVEKVLSVVTNVRGQKTARTALVEQYVDAPEFSVEMFSWGEEVLCIGITEKHLTGQPYFVEHGHIFPARLLPEQEAEILETVTAALRAVGVQYGATHTEIKLTEEGCKIIEINARLAGGMIPELIRLTTGIDMLEQHLLSFVKGAADVKVNAQGRAAIQFIVSETEGTLVSVHGVEEARELPGVVQVTLNAKPGAHVLPPQNAYHRLGFVIAQGETYEQTKQRLADAMDALEVVVETSRKEMLA